jgi:nucleoside-diphosphate-sugar epimerase
MKVIFTGATSALARYCIAQLLDEGHEVVAVIRRGSARKDALVEQFPQLTVVELNLDEFETIESSSLSSSSSQPASSSNPASFLRRQESSHEALLEDAQLFYHFAWEGVQTKFSGEVEVQEQNIKYTLDALKLFAKLSSAARLDAHSELSSSQLGCPRPRFIYAGSQAELGRGVRTEKPTDAYGIAKLAAGSLGKILAKDLGIDFIHTRIFTTYGPGNRTSALLDYIITSLKAGDDLELTKCEQNWDWLHFEDAARAFALLGDLSKTAISPDTIYEIGSGKSVKLADSVRQIRDLINPNATINFGAHPYNKDQQGLDYVADVLALTDLGWKPMIPFEEGIGEVIMKGEINE